jgi:acyl-CoA thioesterase
MEEALDIIRANFEAESFANVLGMRLLELEPGRSVVEMTLTNDERNIFGTAHGGAIFSLIDGAFELAANSHGTVYVAISVNVSFHNAAMPGDVIQAEAQEVSRSRKLSSYSIKVTCGERLVATCQAIAYGKGDKIALP